MSIRQVLDELRAFVVRLRDRPDVEVLVARFGLPAPDDALAAADPTLPPELVAMYRHVDGVHVAWRFRAAPGGGTLHVPPLSERTVFTGDDQHYRNFGEACEALVFDANTPEGTTWLVRRRDTGEVNLVFVSAGEGEGVGVAATIAAYLRAGLDRGFGHDWPRCFRPSRYVSYAEQEAAILRFREPPSPPTGIGVGSRVTWGAASGGAEGGRGTVTALHHAPDSGTALFCGRELVRVALDLGGAAWVPVRLAALVRADRYEAMRDPAFDLGQALATDPAGLLGDLARAIGGSSRLAAGLLGARPLAESLGWWVQLHGAVRGEDDAGVVRALASGLGVLAHQRSAEGGVPADRLVDGVLVARLREVPGAGQLVDVLGRDEVLAAPQWASDPRAERELELPDDAPVWLGHPLPVPE